MFIGFCEKTMLLYTFLYYVFLHFIAVISPVESIKNLTPNSRLNGWCSQLDPATSELKQVEQNLKSLNRILDQLESVDNDVNICY